MPKHATAKSTLKHQFHYIISCNTGVGLYSKDEGAVLVKGFPSVVPRRRINVCRKERMEKKTTAVLSISVFKCVCLNGQTHLSMS